MSVRTSDLSYSSRKPTFCRGYWTTREEVGLTHVRRHAIRAGGLPIRIDGALLSGTVVGSDCPDQDWAIAGVVLSTISAENAG